MCKVINNRGIGKGVSSGFRKPFKFLDACTIKDRNLGIFMTEFMKTVPIGTRNEIHFIADY